MYTDDYEERERKNSGFPIKDFLLKLILIIIFVLLLMWLIPWPNNKALTDRIFNANIQEMKNASLLYFTAERLPVNVGDKVTLTLQEMLDLKLLLPFVDKNGDACDVQASYVTIEKLDEEYLLKVNLKCGDEENYILVHVGCYAYCTTYICEDQTKPEPTLQPVETDRPRPTSNPKPTTTPTDNPNPTDDPGPTDSPDPTNPPEQTSEPSCSLVVTDGTLSGNDYISNVVIGWGHKSSTNGATITEYGLNQRYNGRDSLTITENGTHTVTGYVKDSNGKTAQCEITVTKKNQPVTPDTQYEYEYRKDYAAQYSAWSAWSEEIPYVDADNIPFGSYPLVEVEHTRTVREVVGYRPVTITYKITEPVQVGSYQQSLCTGYTYIRAENTTYYVTRDWYDAGTIYVDTVNGDTVPSNTSTVRYIPGGVQWNDCSGTCSNHAVLVFRVQRREISTYPSNAQESLQCTSVQTQTIPLYASQVSYKTIETREDLYGYVKYYHYRTRTLISNAHTEYTWSSSANDTSLTNNGWVATGRKRVKG